MKSESFWEVEDADSIDVIEMFKQAASKWTTAGCPS